MGNPVEEVRKGLASIHEEFGEDFVIRGACTTGSGRYMIGSMIGADAVKDEITAQARAAVCIDPEVDTIFEPGRFAACLKGSHPQNVFSV